jgi:hypothetical protein
VVKVDGPAIVRGRPAADELCVEQQKRQSAEVVAVQVRNQHLWMVFGSTPKHRMAISDEAPQSSRTLTKPAET